MIALEDLFHQNEITDLWLSTTKAPRPYTQAQFRDGCWLFFGKETAGLPQPFREAFPDRCLRIPMRPDARSLNLANSVAILTYEALRQLDFPQLRGRGRLKGAAVSALADSPGNLEAPPDKIEKKGLVLMNYDKKTIRDIDVSGEKDSPAL